MLQGKDLKFMDFLIKNVDLIVSDVDGLRDASYYLALCFGGDTPSEGEVKVSIFCLKDLLDNVLLVLKGCHPEVLGDYVLSVLTSFKELAYDPSSVLQI